MSSLVEMTKRSPTTGAKLLWTGNVIRNILYREWKKEGGKTNYEKTVFESEERALAALQAHVAKRRRLGFVLVTEVDVQPPLLAMLANKLKDYSPKKLEAELPIFGQPKYDGERMLWHRKTQTMWSRGRQQITMLPELREALIKGNYPSLDGELMCEGMAQNEIHSIVSRQVSDHPRRRDLFFVAYDIPSKKHEQWERLKHLETLRPRKRVQFAPFEIIRTIKETRTYHAKCVEQGFEGAMFRLWNAKYAFGYRTNGLLKLKEEQDEFFLIYDYTKDRRGHLVFLLQSHGGSFRSVVQGSHEYQKKIAADPAKFVGTWAKVSFMRYTTGGVPSHHRITLLTGSKERP